MKTILTAFALLFSFGCATEPLTTYGDTCQQRLSKAGMEQDRSHYYCRSRGR